MKIYDQKMYDFLTQPDNFEPFAELYEQYGKVRNKLVDDFWKSVFNKVEDLWPPDWDWKASLDKENATHRKLRATHAQLALPESGFKAAVVYEFLDDRVMLGTWFHRQHFREDGFSKVCAAAEQFRVQPGNTEWIVGKGPMWFPLYKMPGENFKEKHSLWKIIPTERERLAQTYATEFVDAVRQLGEFCLTHGKTI